jgi:hypothetical protein
MASVGHDFEISMNATLAVDMGGRLAGLGPSPADLDHDLVELALVLPRWQVDHLAAAARNQGLTAGQAIRRLIRGYCADQGRTDR